MIDVLRARATAGCAVRVALGDPDSPKLLERGGEENFGIGIISRADLSGLTWSSRLAALVPTLEAAAQGIKRATVPVPAPAPAVRGSEPVAPIR